MIAMVMYGTIVLQVYFYTITYPSDPMRIKLLVMFMWLLETVHSVFVAHFNYYYLVTSYGHPQNLQYGVWSFFAAAAVNIAINLTVKSFFVTQIRQLCSPPWKRWLPPAIMALVLTNTVLAIDSNVIFFKTVKFALLANKSLRWRVIMLSVTNLTSDTVIVVVLCVLLQKRRTNYPESRVNTVIHNLVMFCVQRFILCSVIGVVQLVTYLAVPFSFYTSSLAVIFGKLYANSLLATLNSRLSLRGTLGGESLTTTSAPLENTHIVRPILLFQPATRDDADGFTLRTRDLEESIRSSKN